MAQMSAFVRHSNKNLLIYLLTYLRGSKLPIPKSERKNPAKTKIGENPSCMKFGN